MTLVILTFVNYRNLQYKLSDVNPGPPQPLSRACVYY